MVSSSSKKSITKIPYFQALRTWNKKCNPLKGKAWVLPYGKTKAKHNKLYDQIVDIRQGINVDCSSVQLLEPESYNSSDSVVILPTPKKVTSVQKSPSLPSTKSKSPPVQKSLSLPSTKSKSPPSSKSPPFIPTWRHPKHFYNYVRAGYNHNKKYTYTYEVDKLPKELKLPGKQVTMGQGSYASVIEGFWNNKVVAVKFQIVDANIPQPFNYRDCATQDGPDCFTMSKTKFNDELKNLKKASDVDIGPKILYSGFVNCTGVTVQPSIANPLLAPKELGLIVMEKIPGIPLYNALRANNKQLLQDWQFEDKITKSLLDDLYVLYDNYRLKWDDMHFGNIMYDTKTDKLTIIDIGDLQKTFQPWQQVKEKYEKIIIRGFLEAKI